MWGITFVVIWIQNETFAYQFYPLILPAIVSLVLYEKETPRDRPGKKFKRENIICASIVLLFGMYCVFYAPVVSYYGSQEKIMNDYFWNQSEIMNNKLDIKNQSSVLFLDTGALPYYTGINSSCRHVAPLVVQRANPNRMFILNLSDNIKTEECILSYNGKYILADGPIGPEDSWFGADTPQKNLIINKIHDEYFEAYSGAWTVYERKSN